VSETRPPDRFEAVAIGVDTGLAHLAAALKTPVIGIYLASDPAATGIHAGSPAVNLGQIGRPPALEEVVAALESLRAT